MAERIGVAAHAVIFMLVAFPPRPLVALRVLPQFFLVAGLFTAYAALLTALGRMMVGRDRQIGERALNLGYEKGVAFLAMGLILAGTGAARAWSLPLIAGALILRVSRLHSRQTNL